MKINPLLFDHKGRMQLGSGYPADVKWHPLYAENEAYHCIAACYSTGEVKLFHVEVDNDGVPKGLSVDHTFILDEPSKCNCIEWSPDGQYIIVGYNDGRLRLFDIFANKQVETFDGRGHTAEIWAVVFTHDNRFVVSGSDDKSIRKWNIKTGLEVPGFNCKNNLFRIYDIAITPNNQSIFSVAGNTADEHINQFDFKTGQLKNTFFTEGNCSVNTVISSDSRFIFSSPFRSNYNILKFDIKTGKRLISFEAENNDYCLYPLSLSPDDKYLFAPVGGPNLEGQSFQKWDIHSGRLLNNFHGKGHGGKINSIAISPDSKFILTSAYDNTIRIWDCEKGLQKVSYSGKGHISHNATVKVSPSGKFVACGSLDKTFLLWDTKNGGIQSGFKKIESPVDSRYVSISPDERFIVNGFCLWDRKTGQLNKKNDEKVNPKKTRFALTTPDGNYTFGASDDKLIYKWETKTGKFIESFNGKGHADSIKCMAISPDGHFIVTGSTYPEMRLLKWGSGKGEIIKEFDGRHTSEITSIAISPDRKFIISGDRDKRLLRKWDMKTGKKMNNFHGIGHQHHINSVAISNDCCFVASGSVDHTVRLWDFATGNLLESFKGKGHTNYVDSIAFTPNGRYIASVSWDHSLILWDLERILGPSWLKEHLATPLILTGVWFPEETLEYLHESNQGKIVSNRPLARCGECGLFFPVEDNMLGKDIGCPNKIGKTKRCDRLVKLNEFTAGNER